MAASMTFQTFSKIMIWLSAMPKGRLSGSLPEEISKGDLGFGLEISKVEPGLSQHISSDRVINPLLELMVTVLMALPTLTVIARP